jgi:hypothetical protein
VGIPEHIGGMTATHSALRTAGACRICGAPLTAYERSLDRVVCGSAACRWRQSQVEAPIDCGHCGAPLPRVGSSRICRAGACQAAERVLEEQRRRAANEAAATHVRGTLAPGLGIRDAERFPVGVVPFNGAQPVPLPVHRIRAFRRSLRTAIRAAYAEPVHSAEPPSGQRTVEDEVVARPVDALLGLGCATCRGSCCRLGQDHAFVSADTIRRGMRARPGRSAVDVLREYVSYLPETTLEHGCVFQRPDGCALPRTLRGDICNTFFCYGLHDFHANYTAGPDDGRAFFVAIDDGRKRAAVFVDGDSVTALGLEDDATASPVSTRDSVWTGFPALP